LFNTKVNSEYTLTQKIWANSQQFTNILYQFYIWLGWENAPVYKNARKPDG
jgi:hypothetical protein